MSDTATPQAAPPGPPEGRSPSAQRICDAAVEHFALRGYDGASLNDIATAVGIRKASLYAHFAGKDALFLTVLDDALAVESAFAAQCFAAEATTTLPGWHYCEQLTAHYHDSPHLRLLLRTAYLPPHSMKDLIGQRYEPHYLNPLLAAFQAKLRARNLPDDDPDATALGHAYLGIIDSLHVLLIYTDGEHLSSRLAAFHRLLSNTLRHLHS